MGRILIVDDDPFYREGIKRVAGRVYEIETAASGAEGLHLLRHNGPFSVVVSDQKMVGMSGIEFLSRAREFAPQTVRIMLTGYMNRDVLEASIREAEVTHFLEKPLATDDFLDCLAAYALPLEQPIETSRGNIEPAVDTLIYRATGAEIWAGPSSVGLDPSINADILAAPAEPSVLARHIETRGSTIDTEEKDDER
ncbi:response regulator [Nisaea acidiphila]|uniref:Response regulator n=1 Tax=Nisaea acidiphila TaxID=1862145 RepID=A0A9J7AUB3_9PROT|nr:response regulator [Nisaea acidiphila]UUX50073.1 response regulator [Nisaea acidiphila]